MHTRAFHRLLATLVVALFSFPAVAQYTLDTSANQKIDEAINQHYLMMNLDKAENLLLGVVEACGDKCRPGTKAKAWMYVGIVRGSGKSDQAGAAEAFKTAKSYDPNVQLDEGLATPETKQTFTQTAAGAAPAPTQPGPATQPTTPAPAPTQEVVPGDMMCGPDIRQVQTHMPIPISCTSMIEPTSAVLKFKEPGAEQWKKIDMEKVGDEFRATVPCDLTGSPGELLFYVGAKDDAGDYIDQYGSRKEPGKFFLQEEPTVAPSFPGGQPVTRCAGGEAPTDDAASDCPPDFPGCASGNQPQQCGDLDWGAACSNSGQCKCGLICEDGACANAPSCATDDDCDTGTCVNGACSVLSDGKPSVGPYKKHWASLDVGFGFGWFGGPNLCGGDRPTDYGSVCFVDGNEWPAGPIGDASNPDVEPSGFAPAQMRVLAGYDYAFTDHMLAGARLGLAFLNTRPSHTGVPDFIPFHAEARFTYSITSLADDGLRAQVFVNGGLGEMSPKVQAGATQLRPVSVDIYKRAGPIFAGGGARLGYAINPAMAVSADLGVAAFFAGGLPTVALEPHLGFSYGF